MKKLIVPFSRPRLPKNVTVITQVAVRIKRSQKYNSRCLFLLRTKLLNCIALFSFPPSSPARHAALDILRSLKDLIDYLVKKKEKKPNLMNVLKLDSQEIDNEVSTTCSV